MVPREGISRDEYLTKKFGYGSKPIRALPGRVVTAASEEG